MEKNHPSELGPGGKGSMRESEGSSGGINRWVRQFRMTEKKKGMRRKKVGEIYDVLIATIRSLEWRDLERRKKERG